MFDAIGRLTIKQEYVETAKAYFLGTPREHEASAIIRDMDQKLLHKTQFILLRYRIFCHIPNFYVITRIADEKDIVSQMNLVQAYIYQRKGFRNYVLEMLKNESKHYLKIDKKIQKLYARYSKKYKKYNSTKLAFDDRQDRIFGSGKYRKR